MLVLRVFAPLSRCLPVLLAAAAALATASPGPAMAGERLAGPVAAEVTRIVDGDTIAVRAHVWLGQTIETLVRLAGIDAPESRAACAVARSRAAAAQGRLAALVAGRAVVLWDVRYGKYAGRVLARVTDADGRDIGATLVAAGLAVPYDRRRAVDWCARPAPPAGPDPM